MGLSSNEVLQQSKNAMAQWEETWRKHSQIHSELVKTKHISHQDMLFKGIGKTCLCIGMSASFEDQIDIIKKYRTSEVDILCVDKAMGDLLKHDIIPNYVVCCDAAVSYEKWCEPYIEKTKDITLLANVNCNVKWAQNWKGPISFFVNKDNIHSEKIFCEISGCRDMIPAGSNVGNSVIIYASHILRYDEYLLLGLDHGWGDDDNYYAFNDSPKRYWMKHISTIDINGDPCYSSNNLLFSCRWLIDFYNKLIIPYNLKMFNCCKKGILNGIPQADLKKKLKHAKKREINQKEKDIIFKSKIKKEIVTDQSGGTKKLNELMQSKNVVNTIVNYVDKEVLEWLN